MNDLDTRPPLDISLLDKIKRQLAETGSVNFEWMHRELLKFEITEHERVELGGLTAGKVAYMFRYGNWTDLRGAQELLDLLKTEIQMPADFQQRLIEAYARYSYGFLFSLTPSLYNGKCFIRGKGEQKYDRVEYTRMRLFEEKEKLGLKEEEITDELIDFIWRVRETLIFLHNNNVKLGNSLTMRNILALPDRI